MSFFDFFGGMPGGVPHGHGDDEDDGPADTNGFYEILGVGKDASQSEIKKAYRKRARELHPDRHPNEREEYNAKFQDLQKANEVLSDENKRKIYDRYGEKGVDRMGRGGHSSGDDILRSFFGGHAARDDGPRKSPAVKCDLDCTLEDVYKGTTKIVECEIAQAGSGGECGRCRGRGRITITQQRGMMLLQSQQACPDCEGQGYDLNTATKTVDVHIPVGAKHGETITIHGEGHQIPNHQAGDILVRLRVAEHEVFTRRGADLGMDYKLTLKQALCGYRIKIDHVSGTRLILESKPGEVTQPGSLKRVFTWGMPQRYSTHVKGHLYVQMEVLLPLSGSLSPEVVTEFARLLPHEEEEKEAEAAVSSQTTKKKKKKKNKKKKGRKNQNQNQNQNSDPMELDEDYIEIVTADNVDGNPTATPASSRGAYDEDDDQEGVSCQQM